MSDSRLSVTPIGVGAAYARTGEVQSAYLVRAGQTTLCLDLGAGALNALQAHLTPHELDAVVISHRHPDHCIDLLALHVYLYWGPGRRRRMRVLGPPGLSDHLRSVGSARGWDESLDFETVGDGSAAVVGDAHLRFAEVPHIPHTFAVRVEHGGRALVYGADCVENDALVALASGADVLIAECGDGPVDVPASPHMSGAGAGRTAARAGVGRLLLTHCFPEHDRDATFAAGRSEFDGQLAWATQGEVVWVG